MMIPFEIPPGIFTDNTTFAAPGVWKDGNNMRPWMGKMQTIGGWSQALSGTVTGICRGLHAWTDNSTALNVAVGTHSALQLLFDGTLFTITPAGLATGLVDSAPVAGYGTGDYGEGDYGEPGGSGQARTWSFSTYGQSLIASPYSGTIYQWNNVTATPAIAVTNAPARCNYAMVTPERQILALGCNEVLSGNHNPLAIRGSDIENTTSWTPTGSNNAFEHILEGGGSIVAGTMLGSYLVVWTDNAVHLGQFLGQFDQTYRFDRVGENCGLIGPNAFAVIGQTAYWLSPDLQFRMMSIGSPPTIIACPVRDDFKDNIDASQGVKVNASTTSQYGEVRWDYPDSRDGNENSRYVAFNALSQLWFKGEMDRTAYIDAGVAGYPTAVSASGSMYYHELGNTANGAPLAWSLLSSDLYLDESRQTMMLKGFRPDFEDQQGPIWLQLHVRMKPQGTVYDKGPWAIAPGSAKADFRLTGAIAAMEFSGESAPAYVRFGKPMFDMQPIGQNA